MLKEARDREMKMRQAIISFYGEVTVSDAH